MNIVDTHVENVSEIVKKNTLNVLIFQADRSQGRDSTCQYVYHVCARGECQCIYIYIYIYIYILCI